MAAVERMLFGANRSDGLNRRRASYGQSPSVMAGKMRFVNARVRYSMTCQSRFRVSLRRTGIGAHPAGQPPTAEMFMDRPAQPVSANKRPSPNLLLTAAVDPSRLLLGSSPHDGSSPIPCRSQYPSRSAQLGQAAIRGLSSGRRDDTESGLNGMLVAPLTSEP